MAYQHRNILVGAADVWLHVETSDEWENGVAPNLEPRNPEESFRETLGLLPGQGSEDWEHKGLTQGGVEMAYSPDYGAVEVDQWLDDALLFKQRQTVSVNTTFAEATLENLLVSWGQGAGTLLDGQAPNPDYGEEDEPEYKPETGAKTLEVTSGELGDEPVERSIAMVGKAPRTELTSGQSRERIYHLKRVIQVEAASHSLSRTEATTVPASFRCLPADPSGGGYGVIIDRVFTRGAESP